MDLTWEVATECPRQHPLFATLNSPACIGTEQSMWGARTSKTCYGVPSFPNLPNTNSLASDPTWELLHNLEIKPTLTVLGLDQVHHSSCDPQVAMLFLTGFFFSKEVGSSSRRSLSRNAFLQELWSWGIWDNIPQDVLRAAFCLEDSMVII